MSTYSGLYVFWNHYFICYYVIVVGLIGGRWIYDNTLVYGWFDLGNVEVGFLEGSFLIFFLSDYFYAGFIWVLLALTA